MRASTFTHNSHLAAGGLVLAVHAAGQRATEERVHRRQSASVAELAAAYRRVLADNAQLRAQIARERGLRLYMEYLQRD